MFDRGFIDIKNLLERKDARGRSKGRTRANARAHSFAQVDHLSGRFPLPLVRFSADFLPAPLPRRCASIARAWALSISLILASVLAGRLSLT